MIVEALYKKVEPLDRVQHRALRMRTAFSDLGNTAQMNAMFITAAEFADACREYPIVFVRAGREKDA